MLISSNLLGTDKRMWFGICDNGGMEISGPAKTGLGGVLLLASLANQFFGVFRSVDFLRVNAPSVYAVVISSQFTAVMSISGLFLCAWGLYEKWKGKRLSGTPEFPEPPMAQAETRGDQSPIQETHGSNSPIAGRDLIYQAPVPIVLGKLSLLFDADDPRCTRSEGGVNREYRAKVINTTGGSAHDVHVKIESTVPELKHHAGVRLRVCHGSEHESSVNLAYGAHDYFNLMEYNPADHAIGGRPVIHICHTAKTVPINVDVHDYEFKLKAYSAESISESVILKFEQLPGGHSRLERVQRDENGGPQMPQFAGALSMKVMRSGNPPDAPERTPELEIRFSDSPPYKLFESPHYTHYRMGIYNHGPVSADNVCVELLEIKECPKSLLRPDFPYRVRWSHGPVTDNAGCHINPGQEVQFELLKYWIASDGDLMVDEVDTKQEERYSRFSIDPDESFHMKYTLSCHNHEPVDIVFFARANGKAVELVRIS